MGIMEMRLAELKISIPEMTTPMPSYRLTLQQLLTSPLHTKSGIFKVLNIIPTIRLCPPLRSPMFMGNDSVTNPAYSYRGGIVLRLWLIHADHLMRIHFVKGLTLPLNIFLIQM